MYKRLRAYAARVNDLLDAAPGDADWDEAIREHLSQISFFQHERLVHLLVTLAFALMELAFASIAAITTSVPFAVLMLLTLALLVPYVVHYYHLENGTQALYAQYDRLLQARRRSGCAAAAAGSPMREES